MSFPGYLGGFETTRPCCADVFFSQQNILRIWHRQVFCLFAWRLCKVWLPQGRKAAKAFSMVLPLRVFAPLRDPIFEPFHSLSEDVPKVCFSPERPCFDAEAQRRSESFAEGFPFSSACLSLRLCVSALKRDFWDILSVTMRDSGKRIPHDAPFSKCDDFLDAPRDEAQQQHPHGEAERHEGGQQGEEGENFGHDFSSKVGWVGGGVWDHNRDAGYNVNAVESAIFKRLSFFFARRFPKNSNEFILSHTLPRVHIGVPSGAMDGRLANPARAGRQQR